MPDFYCQTIDWGFSLRKSIFVENCSFSYIHVFDRESINTQESMWEYSSRYVTFVGINFYLSG